MNNNNETNTTLDFSFDFDEVFEGNKQGIIKEMVDLNYSTILSEVRKQCKADIEKQARVRYSDLIEVKEEIKKIAIEDIKKDIEDTTNNYKEKIEAIQNEIINKRMTEIKQFLPLPHQVINKIEKEIKELMLKKAKAQADPTSITISKKKYDALVKDSNMLNALECAGVDNWEGYSHAFEYMEEDED